MKSTRQILNEAADLVEAGWTRKYYKRRKSLFSSTPLRPCYCLVGAITKAAGGDPRSNVSAGIVGDAWNPMRAVVDQLGLVTYFAPDALTGWNDDSDRTQAEVVEALRATAASLPA